MCIGNAVEVEFGFGLTRVTVYRSNIVRITHIPKGHKLEDSFVVIRKPMENGFSFDEDEGGIRVSTDEVTIVVNKKRNTIEFLAKDIHIVEIDRRAIKAPIEDLFTLEHTFAISNDEALYGLGQHAGFSAHGGFNCRNKTVYLVQRNTDITIPIVVSSAGYAILWDMYSMGVFSSKKNTIKMWFELGKALDFYFIYGPELDKIIQGYRYLTGKAPLLPRYALGYWQSRERYASQEEIVSVARMFKEKGIPIDVIVQDWLYWGKYGWNAFKFDENNYPDPAKMVKDLHNMGIRIIISIWPFFEKTTDIYKEAEKMGCIMGNGHPNFGVVNVFREKCCEWFWKKIEEVFLRIGIDGWWLDASEPEVGAGLVYATWQRELDTGKGTMAKYLNVYPLLEAKAVYEGQRRTTNKRVLILTRSGFTGIQRYGVINWSGDVTGDWTTLRTQVQAGLNYSLSGLPYWTTDVGGFFSGNPSTESYRELFVRWFQFAVFNPVLRVHGTNYPKEPWRFGDHIEKILVKYIKLRYRLIPYIYAIMWKVYNEDYTMMRPLVMDFRDDPEVYDIDDQFMFGPYIMVSPITTPSTYGRDVYLPKGIWYDFWSGDKITGGRYIHAIASLDVIPLHVRAGAILPLAPPDARSAMDKFSEIELRIYRGRSSEFYLYIDDGETYNYEEGDYALIPVRWIEEESKLIISEKVGRYAIDKLRFNVVIVSKEKGVDIRVYKPDKEIVYDGNPIEVKL